MTSTITINMKPIHFVPMYRNGELIMLIEEAKKLVDYLTCELRGNRSYYRRHTTNQEDQDYAEDIQYEIDHYEAQIYKAEQQNQANSLVMTVEEAKQHVEELSAELSANRSYHRRFNTTKETLEEEAEGERIMWEIDFYESKIAMAEREEA